MCAGHFASTDSECVRGHVPESGVRDRGGAAHPNGAGTRRETRLGVRDTMRRKGHYEARGHDEARGHYEARGHGISCATHGL